MRPARFKIRICDILVNDYFNKGKSDGIVFWQPRFLVSVLLV